MKQVIFSLLALITLACSTNEEPENIIREQTYLLHRATQTRINGTATVTELGPGRVKITIQLQNTAAGFAHPAHLHFGSIEEVGELAYKLNDVDGATGKSETVLDQVTLEDGSVLDYLMLQEMNGSIKVHMNDSFFKPFVLTYGNIGQNENFLFDGAATCTGH